jgi:hypothetical protein
VKRLQVLVLVQDPVLVRDQEAVVRLIREADLVQDLEVVPVLAVVPVLVRDLEAALALDPVVVQEVDLEVDRALEVARVLAPLREPMVPERQQELVQLRRDLDPAVDPAVALDLVPVRAVVRDLEAALVLAAVPAPAAAPEVALDPVRALEVVPALEVVLARDREVPALVLTPVKFGGLEFKRFVRY